MPSIPLHVVPSKSKTASTHTGVLPDLLYTPSGLAILEIQGTIHTSETAEQAPDSNASSHSAKHDSIGHLEFPLYDPSIPTDNKWMKKVYLYVGKYQRLTGEVKKLPKPLAVIGKRPDSSDGDTAAELEILEIVKYKLLFSGRPEPVGDA